MTTTRFAASGFSENPHFQESSRRKQTESGTHPSLIFTLLHHLTSSIHLPHFCTQSIQAYLFMPEAPAAPPQVTP